MTPQTFDQSITKIIYIMGKVRTPWWLSFGNLLGLIRDKGLVLDKDGNVKKHEDIDISVFYEDLDEARTVMGFEKHGYKLSKIVRNNLEVPQRPFYLGFDHKELPHLCIFAWYKYGNMRWHTYDTHNQKVETPREYTFKAVPGELFSDIVKVRRPICKREIPVPAKYGTLLDIWYPNWGFDVREGESESEWTRVVPNVKGLK